MNQSSAAASTCSCSPVGHSDGPVVRGLHCKFRVVSSNLDHTGVCGICSPSGSYPPGSFLPSVPVPKLNNSNQFMFASKLCLPGLVVVVTEVIVVEAINLDIWFLLVMSKLSGKSTVSQTSRIGFRSDLYPCLWHVFQVSQSWG